jgi:universal stress protein A
VTDIDAAPTTILFATDGTSASNDARGAAAHLARTSQAALHIVHVWAPTTTISGARGVDEEIASGVAGAEAKLIEEALGCPVAGIHTPYGSRAHGILATAGAVGAGLIVVGGRRLGIVEELFTYRVSEDVVHHSFRPVLLVREDGDEWPPRHIAVGCDGSPEAARALALSGWIARLSDANLVLVAVVDADAPNAEDAARDAGSALEISAASARPAGGTTVVTTRVVTATDVPKALRDVCTSLAGPQLLAIGARGSSALHRVPEFSVSRSVTHHTQLPLLLVPPTSVKTGDLLS